ncbi:MAG: DUF1599 domain-containing protein [Bacteroidota bacterium]|nr:DUF1599 domain-containing protein [Bacteroidota bacterium]MDP4245539.1 DUF1599 domain-containing protein [Bacteroidota bacterium]MDP4256296.1 DUF1599 domain-containing protein [Bacteroidota bacterium]MDP4259731.1 DUF1599 domain-containing protein [Bacteroidota bacterium]
MSSTNQQYDQAVLTCRGLFLKKARDYGTSWRVLRIISIADQLFIKAQRIRTLQQKAAQRVEQRVGDDRTAEFIAMVNYGIIGLIQLSFNGDGGRNPMEDLPVEEVEALYDEKMALARETMLNKNHDYGEAWREMSQESFADLILMKLLRVRQILANEGRTLISEGIDSNFIDIINYSLFALILIGEGKHRG